MLCEWTQSDALRRHGLAVEAAVGWYAEHHFGLPPTEVETWRTTGLVHDLAYERFPETHPLRGAEELRKLGYPALVVEAVAGHGDDTGVPRATDLARTVYACDKLSGFVISVAYVRPNRSLDEVEVESVRKKMKDKGFARQVSREVIAGGAEELHITLDEHIENVISGLKTARAALGL